jgi:hypothetical protein
MFVKTIVAAMFLGAGGCTFQPHAPGARPPSAHVQAPAPLVVRESDSVGVITGVVRDDHGSRRPFAILWLSGKERGVSADSLGRFRLMATPGPQVLVTRSLGYASRADSLRLPDSHGLALEITLRPVPSGLGNICACDPDPPLLTLEFRRPPNRAAPYVIVTVMERGHFPQRDSIVGGAFDDSLLTHTVLWADRDQAKSRSRTVDVTVQVPGFRAWHQTHIVLPAILPIVLEPVP